VKSSIVKRSVIIGGHKTSVSLENDFWDGLREIAEARQMSVSALLMTIDKGRASTNLSSAIRVFVFEHFRAAASSVPPRHEGGQVPSTFVSSEMPPLR